MSEPRTILCMRWGTAYGARDVAILHAMVRRHLPGDFRFLCLTDDLTPIAEGIELRPIPPIVQPRAKSGSPWRKLALFAPELADLGGQALFIDLDVVVLDDLTPFFTLPGDFCIIENWTQPGQGIGNSSVFRFRPGAHPEIHAEYMADPERIAEGFANEQSFVSRRISPLTWWPAEWVRSFKRHCVQPFPLNLFRPPSLPAGARIVAFHGTPKPADAIAGRWPGGGPFRHLRPTPWVAGNWR